MLGLNYISHRDRTNGYFRLSEYTNIQLSDKGSWHCSGWLGSVASRPLPQWGLKGCEFGGTGCDYGCSIGLEVAYRKEIDALWIQHLS